MKRLMAWMRDFFGMLYSPSLKVKIVLALIPFALTAVVWQTKMKERQAINPDDKTLPSIGQMYDAVKGYVTKRDMRTKELIAVRDAVSSLKRVVYGTAIASCLALVLGVLMGVFPWFRAMMIPFVVSLSNIIPPSITIILMVMFGIDDGFKIALICFGLTFLMARDACNAVIELPQEQKIKMLTLGGGSLAYTFYVVVPQFFPRFLKTVQVYLGPAWVYVLTSEQIVADAGLAYRIQTLKRAFDVPLIIPLVILIALIASLLGALIGVVNKIAFPWYFEVKR